MSQCVPGYKVFAQNRLTTHVRARGGSGGVGILVKEAIMQQYNVTVLDSAVEGSLWIQLKHRVNNDC